MRKHRSLLAWQRAREFALKVLEATDDHRGPKSYALFDQLRRSAVSIEANIVEGYALGTTPQFRRHLKISFASAAESETLLELSAARGYLPSNLVRALVELVTNTMRLIRGLIQKLPPQG